MMTLKKLSNLGAPQIPVFAAGENPFEKLKPFCLALKLLFVASVVPVSEETSRTLDVIEGDDTYALLQCVVFVMTTLCDRVGISTVSMPMFESDTVLCDYDLNWHCEMLRDLYEIYTGVVSRPRVIKADLNPDGTTKWTSQSSIWKPQSSTWNENPFTD
jgi:hypothetical protein